MKTGRNKVFNLCSSYRYQSYGYYVSLVAAARGHYTLPSVPTIRDMGLKAVARQRSNDLDKLIQQSLRKIHSEKFELSIYFGSNVSKTHEKLSKHLFGMFPAPFLRAFFKKTNGGSNRWTLEELRLIAADDIPENHRDFVKDQIEQFLKKRISKGRRYTDQSYRYELAILYSDNDTTPPSDPKAIERFRKAAARLNIDTSIIDRNDYAQLSRYDALFIRDTTRVDNYTYRFARRAQVEGMIVIDDPESILRCCNKIYLHELLQANRIPVPKSIVVSKNTVDKIEAQIGFPCVIKLPDSSYSSGVFKVNDKAQMLETTKNLFRQTDLLLVQEFFPSDYDWRVGIVDREPLYVCKYYMARNHWQIINYEKNGDVGNVDTLRVEDAPVEVVETAKKAAGLIGNSLYGVDLKSVDGKTVVIEINDNPSIESGLEDEVLKDELYNRVMATFFQRLEKLHGK